MSAKRRKYYGQRQSFLMPTLFLLLLSILIAFGGAVYWDKLQIENQQEQEALLQNQVEEEISLPQPENEEPSPVESTETPSSQEQKAETDSQETTTETPAEQPEEKPSEQTETPVENNSTPAVKNTSAIVPLCGEVNDSYFTDAAFVGDSLTQGLQLYGVLDTHVVANKGINLQSIYNEDKIRVAEGYTSVFAELERIQPKKIYVQLGMNDIAWRSEGDFIRLYGDLVDNLKAAHPKAVLYVQSIFPVTGWYSLEDNGINNNKVNTYNALLTDLVAEKGCHYLDVHSVLADANGELPNEASPDGIHLNAPYYKSWFNYLKTHVAD